MKRRMRISNLAWPALLAVFAVHLFATDAMAAKEKFERTKPHVNVGTIGHDQQGSGQLTGNTDGQGGSGGATTQSLDPSANGCEVESKTAGC